MEITRDLVTGNIMAIKIPRPSNFHAHFRWDDLLTAVAPAIMREHKYVLGMPNNGPGVGNIIRTIDDARLVYSRIMQIRQENNITGFTDALMTLYHTADTTPGVVEDIRRSRFVYAIKDYPGHGGTTNSGLGVPFDQHDDLMRAMAAYRVPLLIHVEDTHDADGRLLPHSKREGHCITNRLWKFRDKHPNLRICIEHASTIEAIEFVRADASGNTAMTVTPHHLLFTADDFDRYSWRNHLRCMPYVKTQADQYSLLDFATSGDPRCIAGNDNAPHPSSAKNKPFEEAACGCWLPHSIALYTRAFGMKDALGEPFVKFMCWNGPDWWGLSRPADTDTITIREEAKAAAPDPTPLPERGDVVIPLGWTKESDFYCVGFET